MKQIVITITVPDGVQVQVAQSQSNGAASAGGERPFTSRPAPPRPTEPCPVHGTGWHLVPAGVSKRTQKPYNPFWSCDTQDCRERPPRPDPDAPAMTDLSDPFLDGYG